MHDTTPSDEDFDIEDMYGHDDPLDGSLSPELVEDTERDSAEDLGRWRFRTDDEGRPVAGQRDLPRDAEPRTLRPYQTEAVDKVHERWDAGYQRTSVILPTGTGKALSNDTPIPTTIGLVPMGQITTDHQVIGPEGTGIDVLDVIAHDDLELYRVRFNHGEDIVACAEHLWTVRHCDGGAWRTITTADLVGVISRGDLYEVPAMEGNAMAPTPADNDFAAEFWTRRHGRHILDALAPTTLTQRFAMLDYLGVGTGTLTARGRYEVDAMTRLLTSCGYTDYQCRSQTDGTTAITVDPTKTALKWLTRIRRGDVTPDDVATWHPGVKYAILDVTDPAVHRTLRNAPLTSDPAYASLRASLGGVVGPIVTAVDPIGRGPGTCIVVDHPRQLFAAGHRYTMTHNSTAIAKLAVRARSEGKRVVLLAHRNELLSQMADSVYALEPDGEDVGIMAGPNKNPDPAIVAAMFQTLSNNERNIDALGPRDVIIVDEAHHALAPTFLRTLAHLGVDIDPSADAPEAMETAPTGQRHDVVACGFTATMRRADSRRLGALWQSVAYERDIGWAIENGYLVKPTGRTVRTDELDKLSTIKAGIDGDYNITELDNVMRASVPTTVEAVLTHARDRAMIVFAATTEHAHLLADALSAAGIAAASVTGADPLHVREGIYAAFHDGDLQALVTVMVLTEGADFPRCDCVVMARPTRSEVLFCQMVGRAVRTYVDPATGKEKTTALVLDLAGMASDMSLVSLTDMWGPAEVEEYDTEGNTIVEEEEFDDEHGLPDGFDLGTAERTGTADLTTVDLLARAGGPYDNVVVLETPSGVQYVPGAARHDAGKTAWIAWPPNPQPSTPTALIYSDFEGNLSVFRDAMGRIVFADPVTVLNEARRMAYESGSYRSIRSQRRNRAPASDRQMNFLRGLGGFPTPGATKADVGNLIDSRLTDRVLRANTRFLDALSYASSQHPPIERASA